MTPAVAALLMLAGLSEALGRVTPVAVRRRGVPRSRIVRLVLAGAVVEGAVFALWPLTAWTLAELLPASPSPGDGLDWTPGLVTPLVLSAVLAFPLLGPLLHLLLFMGVGAGLTGPLSAATGLGWWTAAGCVAVAGVALGVTVEGVRRLVVRISVTDTAETS
ncbi:hypothetical protein GCM10010095_84300 [Streptomyces anthocyanicus]|uniref:Uncharacterized protein n=1 Tax=Streptomyces violaceoruber TaxID=1935 RepID=A0ACD4X0A0_STRVN|nr:MULTISPECIES: hypothetical protein [Streptomyces]BDD69403.1 hypothetical protein JCM4020_00230 [Streptomyces coelicolor]MCW8123034.1 hypothetical protein [Streptomyces anthocyanicus]MDX3351583.1 hypothetical protein [Streptomyces sp. ME02-6979A]MDX3371135.1 hypothetical protein [Streptomyces sp. ME02-6987-2C]MDX3427155.1 hypothetical protein [Streptomyces sp. ME02-6985-2c]